MQLDVGVTRSQAASMLPHYRAYLLKERALLEESAASFAAVREVQQAREKWGAAVQGAHLQCNTLAAARVTCRPLRAQEGPTGL